MILNKVNNKWYVGSSVNILRERWPHHKSALRYNKHHCKHLQNAWNKYGEDNFEFHVVELNTEHIRVTEQKYIDYGKFNCRGMMYNTSEDVRRPTLGKKQSLETIAKRIRHQKGKPLSDNHKQNLRLVKIGIPLINMRGNGSTRSDKKIYEFRNLLTEDTFIGIRSDFARKYNINSSKLCGIITKRRVHYKGWIVTKIGDVCLPFVLKDGWIYDKERKRLYKSSIGENNPKYNHNIYTWHNKEKNLTEMCTMEKLYTKYGLHRDCVRGLLNGKQKTAFGWTVCTFNFIHNLFPFVR